MITLERRKRSRIANHLLGRSINLHRRNARFNEGRQMLEHRAHQLPSGSHLFDFFFRLADDHLTQIGAMRPNSTLPTNSLISL